LRIGNAHGDDLMRYFEVAKTLDVLYEYFYWPKMKSNVQRIYDSYITYRQAMSKVLPYGLYIPSPISKEPWVDIFMDFFRFT
jgi:hypothetical protein